MIANYGGRDMISSAASERRANPIGGLVIGDCGLTLIFLGNGRENDS